MDAKRVAEHVQDSKQKIIDAVALLVNSHNDKYVVTATVEIPMQLPVMPERGDLSPVKKEGYNGECCITIKRTLKSQSEFTPTERDVQNMRETSEAIKQAVETTL